MSKSTMDENLQQSGEIEEMILGWKKIILKFFFRDNPKRIYTIKNPKEILWYYHQLRSNSQIRMSLKKAFELKDVPEKIWGLIKRIKYLPMFIRSYRNRKNFEKATK